MNKWAHTVAHFQQSFKHVRSDFFNYSCEIATNNRAFRREILHYLPWSQHKLTFWSTGRRHTIYRILNSDKYLSRSRFRHINLRYLTERTVWIAPTIVQFSKLLVCFLYERLNTDLEQVNQKNHYDSNRRQLFLVGTISFPKNNQCICNGHVHIRVITIRSQIWVFNPVSWIFILCPVLPVALVFRGNIENFRKQYHFLEQYHSHWRRYIKLYKAWAEPKSELKVSQTIYQQRESQLLDILLSLCDWIV